MKRFHSDFFKFDIAPKFEGYMRLRAFDMYNYEIMAIITENDNNAQTIISQCLCNTENFI